VAPRGGTSCGSEQVAPPRPARRGHRQRKKNAVTTVSLRSRATGFASGSSKPSLLARANRIIEYRRILKLLVSRDLKVRYAGSALGYLWTILDPLLMSIVYWIVFTKLFQRNICYSPYILFLVAGQLPWYWFTGGVSGTARSLRSEGQMVRSTNVPRELWIIRTICSKGAEYIFGLPVLAIFALAYLKAPNWHLVLLPIAWVMIFVLLSGFGLLLAPLTVLVRDIDRIIPIFLRVMFYMSPVLYSVHVVTQRAPQLRFIYDVNPMVGPLLLARSAFFPQELHWHYVFYSAIECVLVFAVGLFMFTRLERQVLKEI
jgi:ABC-2 type transport system permease protein